MVRNAAEVINAWKVNCPSLSPMPFAETHISWIIRTRQLGDAMHEAYIFKIKKPVKFSFLDYSTLEKRKFYCKEEVRLNRRLSEEIYLGVSILVERDGRYAFVNKAQEGDKIVEYAVKMKVLPQEQKMDKLLEDNKITRLHIIALAQIVADFHRRIRIIRRREYGAPQLVKKQIDDLRGVKDIIDKNCKMGDKVGFILKKCARFISKNKGLIRKRQLDGKIRNGHGDLHSANIFYLDGKFYIFDCIEFNKFFRYIDVASEIAFMAMDLDAFGREDLSKLFVDTYVKLTQDTRLLDLLNLYKCYRANVRTKVAALAMAQGGEEGSKENIAKYLLLCERYAKEL